MESIVLIYDIHVNYTIFSNPIDYYTQEGLFVGINSVLCVCCVLCLECRPELIYRLSPRISARVLGNYH